MPTLYLLCVVINIVGSTEQLCLETYEDLVYPASFEGQVQGHVSGGLRAYIFSWASPFLDRSRRRLFVHLSKLARICAIAATSEH